MPESIPESISMEIVCICEELNELLVSLKLELEEKWMFLSCIICKWLTYYVSINLEYLEKYGFVSKDV